MKLRLEDAGTATDEHDREIQLSILYADNIPVAIIHSEDQADRYNSADGRRTQHVIQGIELRGPGRYSMDRKTFSHASCPTRSMVNITIADEHAELPNMAQYAQDSYEETRGFYFVKWGKSGDALPEDASEAFMRGVEDAKKRFNRIIRNGKLTGSPRSY